MVRAMGLYQTATNLPIWLDLAWLVSATCKKKKNALDRIGEPLGVLQDGKARGKSAGADWVRSITEQIWGLCERSNDPALSQGRGFEGH